ncbi:MAG: hypothetical protein B5M46_02855 [Epsilonproteobacteria bacterium 4484_20]|nr:MAG: hypothetical protein B5M46_02855 [Epsilonproteobacteria bacterium 4484_20]
MKKKFLLSVLTCGLLLGTTAVQAQTDKKELVRSVVQERAKQHKTAPKDIIAGMQNTFAALKAMQANKKDEAKKALEAATKSFDAALKADPSLDLIPIDERFQSYIFMGSEAMNSLVLVKVIIPTPLLAAQDLITEASRMDKQKKEEVGKLLSIAKEELKRAELLGYVSRHEADYKLLNDDIEKIEKEIKGKNAVEKLYETLKNDFKHIIANTKLSKMTPEETAEKKISDFEKKEVEKAVRKKDEFRREALQDETKTVK